MTQRVFLLHALSPLHAGTGHAVDVIDLPIARYKSTGMPFVPGSSIKGVLRDVRCRTDPRATEAVFGPSENASEHAGALVVGDARLLALPVRSFRGTFAWVTSPLLLMLARRDLSLVRSGSSTSGSTEPSGSVDSSLPPLPPDLSQREALLTSSSVLASSGGNQQKVYFQEIDLPGKRSSEADAWARWLARWISPGTDVFTKRFAIVDDETMTFFWETATQVDARVRIDDHTRTVASGALWLEESLPPETVLVGVMAADRSRRPGVDMLSEEVLNFALPRGEEILQFGGKSSIGRGRCRMIRVE